MDDIRPGEYRTYLEPTRGLDVAYENSVARRLRPGPNRAELIGNGVVDHLSAMHRDPITAMVAQRGAEATLAYEVKK